MRYLLDLLERQIALIEKTAPPDYDLIREVVDYFRKRRAQPGVSIRSSLALYL